MDYRIANLLYFKNITKHSRNGTDRPREQVGAFAYRDFTQSFRSSLLAPFRTLPSFQFSAVLVLAREGNFTQAAEALGITQPTLSKQIQDLEVGYLVKDDLDVRVHLLIKL